MQRAKDATLFEAVARSFNQPLYGFDAREIVGDERNVLLQEGEDFGLFEFEYPGVFSGHYFFKDAKGKEALNLARRMLNEMFARHGASVIQGLVPIDNKPATWITRKLGFDSYGFIDHEMVGPHEIFICTLDQFYAKWKGLESK